MSNEGKPSVNGFFESYRAAFEALNAPAITDHFTYPLHITSDAGEISLTVIETRDDWIEQVYQLLDMYRAVGFSSARILELAVTELSPRIIQAVVHWGLYDSAGGILYDFHAMYTLVMINGSLRIAAISHDEIPKYQAVLSRLKS
jgi:hypothetical protein